MKQFRALSQWEGCKEPPWWPSLPQGPLFCLGPVPWCLLKSLWPALLIQTPPGGLDIPLTLQPGLDLFPSPQPCLTPVTSLGMLGVRGLCWMGENHRIIKCPELESTHKNHQVQLQSLYRTTPKFTSCACGHCSNASWILSSLPCLCHQLLLPCLRWAAWWGSWSHTQICFYFPICTANITAGNLICGFWELSLQTRAYNEVSFQSLTTYHTSAAVVAAFVCS